MKLRTIYLASALNVSIVGPVSVVYHSAKQ